MSVSEVEEERERERKSEDVHIFNIQAADEFCFALRLNMGESQVSYL